MLSLNSRCSFLALLIKRLCFQVVNRALSLFLRLLSTRWRTFALWLQSIEHQHKSPVFSALNKKTCKSAGVTFQLAHQVQVNNK